MSKFLVVITGPTACGKTDLCVRLAKHFQTEVISADSRQFFREMSIGTAKPDISELEGVKHHFIDSHSVFEEYNAGQYESDVLSLLALLFKSKNPVIMTGGSGMYIQAVCEGFDALPEGNAEVRAELNSLLKERGLEVLLEELKEKDPVYFSTVDRANPQRVIRALEVIRCSGKPYSSFRKKEASERPFKSIKICIERPREELYDRINRRVDLMMEHGLLKEAERLYENRHLNPLQTVGYQELFDFMEGKTSLEEAVELIKRNTRRYAKRQITWFRRDPEMNWFPAGAEREIQKFIEDAIRHS
ncbi:tRNA (adenosine(37)-N6)-dimethylallyltransferase MiaA [Cytophagaceae bacterium ABcell3]|nr:tRNA (adenosine(37)-N6)-dimethylallyltransferase MiaA [Cytophagaceae bacterium ABcell3]